PGDGLRIEDGAWIAHFVIQIAASFDLKARQHVHNFAICFNHLGGKVFADTIRREKLKKRRVPEIFLEISALAQIFSINFRHRQTVPAKMPGKFEEGDIFFAHAIQNANRADLFAEKPDDLAPRASKLALERLHSLDRRMEMLFKKLLENVHGPKTSLVGQGSDGEWLKIERSKKALGSSKFAKRRSFKSAQRLARAANDALDEAAKITFES